VKILTVQHAIPSTRITNDTVIAAIRERNRHLDASQLAQIEDQLTLHMDLAGTQVRYVADVNESALERLLCAGRNALKEAALEPGEIDFLIYTGVGRGWLEPAMANVVQYGLRLDNATCFDVLDACLSWLRGLHIAHTFIRAGVYRRGLLVNCECGLSQYAELDVVDVEDFENRIAVFTIGEAATATIVTADDAPDDFYFVFKNFGEDYGLCMIPLENASAFMLGDSTAANRRPLKFYSESKRLITTTLKRAVEVFQSDPRLSSETYDLIFAHAASEKANLMFGRRVGLDASKYYPTHPRYGNTVSASIPLGMSLALEEGRLQRGFKTLAAVGSAGVSIGFAAFTY
jgi:3-oxoacyl-[acyl-carrier-protein] synthase III